MIDTSHLENAAWHTKELCSCRERFKKNADEKCRQAILTFIRKAQEEIQKKEIKS